MTAVTVSQKGWVVIPSQLRRKYHWEPGNRVQVVDYGGVVSLVPMMENPVDDAMGALKKSGRSLLKALMRERAKERRREKARK